jgi:hypothetical protein
MEKGAAVGRICLVAANAQAERVLHDVYDLDSEARDRQKVKSVAG